MPENSSLEGKVAVITGSTQGLGEAAARLFRARGIRGLIVTGRNVERGKAVAESLSGGGCEAHFVAADLDKVEECRQIVAAADRHFGTLHVLVNCAAFTDRGTIWDTTPALFDTIMAVNVRAPFFLIQDAVKIMQREGIGGSIVNISSVAAYGSMPELSPYAVSKGALNVLTKNVAYSVMRLRIRVNALNVGWMDTPGEDAIQQRYHGGDPLWLQKAEAARPFGRLVKADEVARAIAYLASDESGLMTGSIIDFDQSVAGAGPQSIPPPMEEWAAVTGVRYG